MLFSETISKWLTDINLKEFASNCSRYGSLSLRLYSKEWFLQKYWDEENNKEEQQKKKREGRKIILMMMMDDVVMIDYDDL